jgi:hypothetical protein
MPGTEVQRTLILVFRSSTAVRIHFVGWLLLLSSWWPCQRVCFSIVSLFLELIYAFHIRNIRLPGDISRSAPEGQFQKALDTIASVPWFLVGLASIVVEWVSSRADKSGLRSRRGYRNVPIDEDAQVLRFEDEE